MKKRTNNLHRRALAILLSVMMCVSMLQINASAWTITLPEGNPTCGKTAHTHSEACYTVSEGNFAEITPDTKAKLTLICGMEEGQEEPHVHTADCEKIEETIQVLKEDCGHHTHTDECYEDEYETVEVPKLDEAGNPVMEGGEPVLDENGEPVVDENGNPVVTEQTVVYETVQTPVGKKLTCTESTEHTDACYDSTITQTVYKCDPKPTKHVHTAACYRNDAHVLLCGQEEHTHTKSCYQEDQQQYTDEQITNTINNTLNGTVENDNQLVDKDDGDANTITLQLNGYTVELTNAIIVVNGKTLIIVDGKVTGGTLIGANGQSVVEVNNGGTLVLNGGTLTHDSDGDGKADSAGSGVVVEGGNAQFTMKDGAISGNTAGNTTNYNGGGVYVNGGTFEMEGGEITNNTAHGADINGTDDTNNGLGGGVYVTGNKENNATDRGTFTMSGDALISNNEADEGGGVYIENGKLNNTFNSNYGGYFEMNGGTVDGNVATKGEGGGIYIQGTGTITAGNITNNTTWTQSNLGGGGIYIENCGRLELENVVITNNTASGIGGGIAGCIHGATSIIGVNGAAVFDNETAVWKDGSGSGYAELGNIVDGSADWKEGFADDANDIFSNGQSTSNTMTLVSNQIMGGGQANWTGSSNGESVTNDNGFVVGKGQVGLTSHISDEDKTNAMQQGTVFISGNHSAMHGGGIGNNGILLIGGRETNVSGVTSVEIPVEKDLTGDKQLNEMKDVEFDFEFELMDSALNTVNSASISGVTLDKDGSANITIPESAIPQKAGTYTFYVREKNTGDNRITYDSTMYRVTIKVTESSRTDTFGRGGAYGDYEVTYTSYKAEILETQKLTYLEAGLFALGVGSVVKFENEYKAMGELIITKNVVVDPTASFINEIPNSFSFLVTGKDFSQQVELNAGNSYTAKIGNLPVGDYQVYELASELPEHFNLTVDGVGTATVKDKDETTVTVTNTYTRKTGSLEISKAIAFDVDSTQPGINTDVEFTFRIDGPTDYDGPATVKVRNGQTVTIPDVPTDEYTITEVDTPDIQWYTYAGNDLKGSYDVVEGTTTKVSVTNNYTRDRGSLTIDKTVVGGPASASTDKTYLFTVTGPEGYNESVTITGASSVTLTDLPTGDYTVTESFADASIPGYSLSVTGGGAATVVKGGNATVDVTNTYTEEGEEPTPTPAPTPPQETPQPTPPEEEELPDPTPPLSPVDPEPTPPEEEELPEPTPPLAPVEEEELPEPTPPLTPVEEEELPEPTPPLTPVEEEELPDPDVPLANVPKTGDAPIFWYAMLILSAGGLLTLRLTSRRKATR